MHSHNPNKTVTQKQKDTEQNIGQKKIPQRGRKKDKDRNQTAHDKRQFKRNAIKRLGRRIYNYTAHRKPTNNTAHSQIQLGKHL